MVVGQENSRDRPDMVAARGSLVLTDGDEAIATQLIEDATAFGIQTTWCRDGAEALFAVGAESPPDVLVIAARTDTVDTVDVASAVRNRSTVPILVGSAVGENDLVRAALAAGASAVISRPYDITAIAPFAFGSSSRQERKNRRSRTDSGRSARSRNACTRASCAAHSTRTRTSDVSHRARG